MCETRHPKFNSDGGVAHWENHVKKLLCSLLYMLYHVVRAPGAHGTYHLSPSETGTTSRCPPTPGSSSSCSAHWRPGWSARRAGPSSSRRSATTPTPSSPACSPSCAPSWVSLGPPSQVWYKHLHSLQEYQQAHTTLLLGLVPRTGQAFPTCSFVLSYLIGFLHRLYLLASGFFLALQKWSYKGFPLVLFSSL